MIKGLASHKRINKESFFSILFSGLAAVISIATTFFIAKPLGTEQYGKIQYWLGIINTLSLFLVFGFPTFFAKNAQFAKDKKAFFSQFFYCIDILSAAILPFFFLICFFGLSGLEKNVLLIFILFFCSFWTAIGAIIGPFLIGDGKPGLGIFLESFLPRFLLFIPSAILAAFSLGRELTNLYLYIFLASYSVSYIPFLCLTIRKTKIVFQKEKALPLIVFFILNFSSNIQSNLSKIILGEISKTYDVVGVFSLSLQIITMGTLFSGVITSVSRPTFSRLSQEKDLNGLFNFFQKILRINCYIAIPFLMAFVIEAKQVLQLFGTDYAAYPLMMVLLGIAYLLNNISGPVGTMLVMSGHEKLELVNSITSMTIFFVLGIILAHVNVYGLPIAILASSFIAFIQKNIEIRQIFHKNPYTFPLVSHIVLLLAFSGICFYDLTFITSGSYWLIANIVVGLGLIVLFFVSSPQKDYRFFQKEGNSHD